MRRGAGLFLWWVALTNACKLMHRSRLHDQRILESYTVLLPSSSSLLRRLSLGNARRQGGGTSDELFKASARICKARTLQQTFTLVTNHDLTARNIRKTLAEREVHKARERRARFGALAHTQPLSGSQTRRPQKVSLCSFEMHAVKQPERARVGVAGGRTRPGASFRLPRPALARSAHRAGLRHSGAPYRCFNKAS